MDDADSPENFNWLDFPRILVKAMTVNTYFLTMLIEMSQKK